MIVQLLAIGNEGVKNPTVWYPTVLGVLVVVAGVVLFCGSIYLLLSTNLGARLGFLVTAAALSGFMVLLSALWMTTASPLNTLKGRVPSWKLVEKLGPDLARSRFAPVHDIVRTGHKDDPTEATNVKAAADAFLVVQQPVGGVAPPSGANKYAEFQSSTDYLQTNAYETGGSGRTKVDINGSWPFLHVSFHRPKFAVAQICPVDQAKLKVPFGTPPPTPSCDTSKPTINVVFERDLGSLRIPPTVVFLASLLLFGLSLLGLHWWERDEQEAAAAKAKEQQPTDLVPAST